MDFLLIISNSDGRLTVCRLTLLQIDQLESIFRVLITRNHSKTVCPVRKCYLDILCVF